MVYIFNGQSLKRVSHGYFEPLFFTADIYDAFWDMIDDIHVAQIIEERKNEKPIFK